MFWRCAGVQWVLIGKKVPVADINPFEDMFIDESLTNVLNSLQFNDISPALHSYRKWNFITENVTRHPHSTHNALLEFVAEVELAKNRGHSLMKNVSLSRPFTSRILMDKLPCCSSGSFLHCVIRAINSALEVTGLTRPRLSWTVSRHSVHSSISSVEAYCPRQALSIRESRLS